MNARQFAPAAGRVDCAALVVTYNSAHDIGSLLDSLRRSDDALALRVVVIDNGSSDGTVEIVEQQPDVVLVRAGGNLGYAGAINLGRAHASECDAHLVLNPDVVLTESAVAHLWKALQSRGVGASVPKIFNEDGTVYESLRREPTLARAFGDALRLYRLLPGSGRLGETVRDDAAYRDPHPVDWATGAVMLISAECATRVGEWDERYFLYSEETDYARRIRTAGWTVQYVPSAEAMHRIGGSAGPSALGTLLSVNRVRYYEKFHSRVPAAAFRAIVLMHHALRANRAADRATAATIARRSSWSRLPQAQRVPDGPA